MKETKRIGARTMREKRDSRCGGGGWELGLGSVFVIVLELRWGKVDGAGWRRV